MSNSVFETFALALFVSCLQRQNMNYIFQLSNQHLAGGRDDGIVEKGWRRI